MGADVHHGKQLRKLLEAHNMDMPSFFELLREEISSISTAYKLLESAEIGKARLCLICTLFNVPPTYFGKPDNYFEPVAKQSETPKERLIIYNYISERKTNYKEFVDKYFETFTTYLCEAKHSIQVLDYLASKNGLRLRDHIGYFNDENAKYFKQLEQNIRQRIEAGTPFFYERICQLPLHAFAEETKMNQPVTFEQKIELTVESLFIETFEHFCYCYENFAPEYFKLYVVEHPVRLFSYYIADDQWILSEYLRFDLNGMPIPDMLFVDGVPWSEHADSAKKIIANYSEELKKLKDETPRLGKKLITKDLFYYCTGTRLAQIERQLAQKEQELEVAEQEFHEIVAKAVYASITDFAMAESDDEKNAHAKKLKLEQTVNDLRQIRENLVEKTKIIQDYLKPVQR